MPEVIVDERRLLGSSVLSENTRLRTKTRKEEAAASRATSAFALLGVLRASVRKTRKSHDCAYELRCGRKTVHLYRLHAEGLARTLRGDDLQRLNL